MTLSFGSGEALYCIRNPLVVATPGAATALEIAVVTFHVYVTLLLVPMLFVPSPVLRKSPPICVQFTLVLRRFQLATPVTLFKVFSVQSLVSLWTETFRAAVAVPPIFVRLS